MAGRFRGRVTIVQPFGHTIEKPFIEIDAHHRLCVQNTAGNTVYGLFGQPAPAAAGLFGQPAAAAAPGGLFGLHDPLFGGGA